jgi:hypothetical protein
MTSAKGFEGWNVVLWGDGIVGELLGKEESVELGDLKDDLDGGKLKQVDWSSGVDTPVSRQRVEWMS